MAIGLGRAYLAEQVIAVESAAHAIHKNCFETADRYGTPGNYLNGANIGGFVKIANAMLDQGLV